MSKRIEIRKNGSKRVSTINVEKSKTDPSFAEQADVNFIMSRYRKTGQITHLARRQGVFADVSNIPDLLGAYQAVAAAQDAFKILPAKLREKLGNDPARLPGYLKDPNNFDEAVSYGLIEKPKQAGQEYPPGSKQAEGALGNPKKGKKEPKNPPKTNDDQTTTETAD